MNKTKDQWNHISIPTTTTTTINKRSKMRDKKKGKYRIERTNLWNENWKKIISDSVKIKQTSHVH